MITKWLTAQEVPLTFEGGRMFLEEAGWPKFNPDAFRRYWSVLIGAGIGEITAMLDDGKIVAALGAAFIEDPFTGEQTAMEQFFWTHPDHRKSGLGLQLWESFEVRAKERGCKQVVMVHLSSLNLQKVFEHRGYKIVEQTFRKKL